ncbi:hypothetical protein [Halomonas sp. JS92-SW72]|uniref:hypothetical protein n=1 Tax=Halomonas sp. JS92-SW72 TaxID=2306583 RepID=UPI000E5A15DF|nr:hypothetical protein [Halomonas sp. JS92-SW72]AXY41613.1 hypothetical protein D1793_05045 [Halomonas sp. JS92-SW72]
MLSVARKLVPAWVWAALLGLLALGGLGWWGVTTWEGRVAEREALAQEVEALTANRDRWQQRTMDVLEQLGQARERTRQAEAALAELQEALAERDADYREIRRRIREAPAQDDGPVAPVLRRALEELPHAD